MPVSGVLRDSARISSHAADTAAATTLFEMLARIVNLPLSRGVPFGLKLRTTTERPEARGLDLDVLGCARDYGRRCAITHRARIHRRIALLRRKFLQPGQGSLRHLQQHRRVRSRAARRAPGRQAEAVRIQIAVEITRLGFFSRRPISPRYLDCYLRLHQCA